MKNHLFTFKSSSATDFFNTLAFLQKEELPEQETEEQETEEQETEEQETEEQETEEQETERKSFKSLQTCFVEQKLAVVSATIGTMVMYPSLRAVLSKLCFAKFFFGTCAEKGVS